LPRPPAENEVRKAVRDYLAAAVGKSAEDAPLNVLAVAKQAGFDRKTLKKYGLHLDVAAAAQAQSRGDKMSPRETEQRSHADALREREREIAALRMRCEGLVARICLAEGNAQRLGIDPVELWKPLASPDRSVPHAGLPRGTRR
jgi:hypothetical protein